MRRTEKGVLRVADTNKRLGRKFVYTAYRNEYNDQFVKAIASQITALDVTDKE